MLNAVEWCGSSLRFLDQTKLPHEESYITTSDYRVIIDAIKKLRIRGAPLIGIAAAYGVCLAGLEFSRQGKDPFLSHLKNSIQEFSSSRPTAVNLYWALNRMEHVLSSKKTPEEIVQLLIHEAIAIHKEDTEACRKIGELGASLFTRPMTILTHCNTGALATGGEGTALSVILHAHRQGKLNNVFVDETRPLLQGARLTTWELKKNNIEPVLIVDSMAGTLMKQKKIDCVIVGADRIASNGDVANKIGTYSLAVLAQHHRIPFYVAAPTSTIDTNINSGDEIPIEERSGIEIITIQGQQIAPSEVKTYSPAFDVTPAVLVSALITDKGIFTYPYSFGTTMTN